MKQILVPVGIIAALGILVIFIGGYSFGWTWTGLGSHTLPKSDTLEFVPAKTLWDWMQLLIVPAVLAGGAFLLNQLNTETQNKIALDNQRDAALQTYIDDMSGLLLEKGLRESKEDAEIRNVARTRTLTVSRRLDGDRKGMLVRFLQEARLISKSDAGQNNTIIALRGAELSSANLYDADLSDTDLSGTDLSDAWLFFANLSGANLSDAILDGANLNNANLSGANLNHTHLNGASLAVADLRGADLSGAFLRHADLSHADLSGSDLSAADLSDEELKPGEGKHHADLSDANLSRANLSSANLTNADLRRADLSGANMFSVLLVGTNLTGANLHGATLWDGSKHD